MSFCWITCAAWQRHLAADMARPLEEREEGTPALVYDTVTVTVLHVTLDTFHCHVTRELATALSRELATVR